MNTQTNETATTETTAAARERESIVFQVPFFPGWYGSFLDQGLDHEIERDCEYIATERDSKHYASEPDSNFNFPEALKLTESDVSDAYYGLSFCAYREARNIEWLDSLAAVIEEEAGKHGRTLISKESLTDNESRWQIALAALAASLKYESMSSPREYNFTTDRLFAFGRLQAFRVMLKLAREGENRLPWAAIVRERHSSRDGFHSWYPADASEWPDDIREFDHNHLATLLAFAIQQSGRWESADQLSDQITDQMIYEEDSAFWTHVRIGDSTIAEIRGRKLCEWLESESRDDWGPECPALLWLAANPESPVTAAAIEYDGEVMRAAREALASFGEGLPLRCDKTPDMFAGESAGE